MRYKEAGVDIAEGNALVEMLKPMAAATRVRGVMGGLGGFSGLFDLKAAGFRDPVLAAGTDGVGTKLILAREARRHGGVGIDLAAMCFNDLLAQGAKPLFFLDYFACGKLEKTDAAQVIAGICEGCSRAGAALLGGETAEMPGMYEPGHYDLAGFALGAAERDALLPLEVRPGDVFIALGSSGAHSNGYSLIRRILAEQGLRPDSAVPWDAGRTVADVFLEPTVIYEPYVRPLLDEGIVRALAHVTGGGVTENLPRVLSAGVRASVDPSKFPVRAEFLFLAEAGQVSEEDMLRTFNCGVGLVLAVAPEHAERALAMLAERFPLPVAVIGVAEACEGAAEVRYSGRLFG